MTHANFLTEAGWANATATPLAGDASTRRYIRLSHGAQTAILMDAPVDSAPDRASYTAFRAIGAHLRSLGLSAPKEIHAKPAKGLILMEDLGNMSFARLMDRDAVEAHKAYRATAAMLEQLRAIPLEDLHAPEAPEMSQMVTLAFEYLPGSDALRDDILNALSAALTAHALGPPVLSLRDVHAENLLWLPMRKGHARVGLLDFQDALMLPKGYDLASLLDDPRREVPEVWRAELIAAYSTPARIAVLSLQRNLRILGIFRRLSVDLDKPDYAAFLPRTRMLIARAASALPALEKPVHDLLNRTAHWGTP